MTTYAHNPSASRRFTAFVLFVIGVALTISLFYVKTRSQTASQQVAALEKAIATQEAAIDVLNAELAYRQNPERISKLSKEYLGLSPISTQNTIKVSALGLEVPFKEGGGEDE